MRDRSRRQPGTRVGIVGPIALEVCAAQVAVEFFAQAIDHGGVGLQPHATPQTLDEDAGDARTLVCLPGLPLDDRCQDQCLVLVLERQVGMARRPAAGEFLAHAVTRLAQHVDVTGALAEQVRVGKEKTFGVAALLAQCAHHLGVTQLANRGLEGRLARERPAQFRETSSPRRS